MGKERRCEVKNPSPYFFWLPEKHPTGGKRKHENFLRLILTRWDWAASQSKVCKLALTAHCHFADTLAADLIQSIFACGGDWQAAAEILTRENPGAADRLKQFRQWAKRITSPARRGLLLTWKGGAL